MCVRGIILRVRSIIWVLEISHILEVSFYVLEVSFCVLEVSRVRGTILCVRGIMCVRGNTCVRGIILCVRGITC